MKIQEDILIKLNFTKIEYAKCEYSFHIGDLIMYCGDTFKVIKIIDDFETKQVTITLQLLSRGTNFYTIIKDPWGASIRCVANYIANCEKER